MKGLTLYGRRHCWLTWRSYPWWSHLMVYSCGCDVVGKRNCFTIFVAMRFFWLPLLTMNCSGEPFTHIWEWKRCSSSSGSLGSSFWIFMVATMTLGFTSIICFPLSFPFLGSDSESEHASDSEAFSSATSDCLPWHSLVLWVELFGTHTTFPCPSSASQCSPLLLALVGCLGSYRLGFVLCSVVWEHISLALDLQIQSITSSV